MPTAELETETSQAPDQNQIFSAASPMTALLRLEGVNVRQSSGWRFLQLAHSLQSVPTMPKTGRSMRRSMESIRSCGRSIRCDGSPDTVQGTARGKLLHPSIESMTIHTARGLAPLLDVNHLV